MNKTHLSNLIIIGCGNVGMRHLEGILKLKRNTIISIVEPKLSTRKFVESFLLTIDYDKNKHSIHWYESIDKLNFYSDLVIVATTSIKRIELIIQLMEMGHIRFLIEKVVCQSEEEYDLLLSNLKKFNAKGWVNTNRRYFSSYQKIKKLFPNNKPICMIVKSGNKGLGSNAIHFIDLFNWFIENECTKLNGNQLINTLFPNKRSPELLEFAGTIIGSNKKSNLIITFLPHDSLSTTIDILNNTQHLLIDETNETIVLIKGKTPNIKFKYEHVSSITPIIIEDIIKNDTCILPTAEQTYFSHKELFRIFNIHIKKILNEDKKLCPIT